ncbi:MAG: hypothetical protein KKA81_14905 [Bacteroidetes bacterium]|nr:hypothetical protein [Bacteroidota bacterium]
MKNIGYLLLLSILALLVSSCVSKRLAKKGYDLEQAGMVTEAADYYFRALLKKKDNVPAIIGLKRTGQLVLDDKLGRFYNAYKNNQVETAVNAYLDARKYADDVDKLGVDLIFPHEYEQYYDDVKSTHLSERYSTGYRLLQEERFQEAAAIFREIIVLEDNYKDVKALYHEARNEPDYRAALEAMDQKKFRKAYDLFGMILHRSGNYKNAELLQDKSLEEGRVTIVLLPVRNLPADPQVSRALQNELQSGLARLSNPFLQLIDPAMAGSAKAILSCEIQDYKALAGPLQSTKMKGFLKQEYKVKNPETGLEETRTKYDKVYYQEYEKTNSVSSSISYKLVSRETGEVLSVDRFTLAESDKMHYVEFTGGKGELIPGYWEYQYKASDKDEIRDNYRAKSNLQRLLSDTRQIRSIESLKEDMIQDAANRIAGKINAYNPE